MNLDELRAVQNKERQKDSLQHLRESFYADVADYVEELRAERDAAAEAAEDPFADPEVRQLTDEIETATDVVEAVYERRLGKLVKRASLAAADMPADDEGLTAEERDLFDDLVGRIEESKAEVLDVLDADREAVSAAEGESVTAPAGPQADGTPPSEAGRAPPEPDPADAGTAGEAAADSGTPAPAETPSPEPAASDDEATPEHGSATGSDGAPLDTRTTVRVTGDVDEFYGVDQREYDLDQEDVVTLPAENAEPLVESGDAERLD